jgi:hypothetical protein
MCRLGGVAASLLVVVVAWLWGVDQSLAQDVGDGKAVEHFLFFSGADLWRNGDFVHGGMLWSPNGLEREGFTLKLLLSGGSYRYNAGTTPIVGNMGLVDVLPGWRFKRDQLEVTVFAGLDLQHHWTVPDDPGNRLLGNHVGFRAGIDLWYQPTEKTMAAVSVLGSTIDTNVWARGAVGVRFLDRVWLGPEVLGFADRTYNQWRAGFHVTSFQTGPYEWSAGAGYVSDSDHHSGPYGRIGLLMRR